MNSSRSIYKNPVDESRMKLLRSSLGSGMALILTHDNPDPDAFASGKAFATLFQKRWSIPCRLIYSGLVARAENKAMLKLLTPDWEQEDAINDMESYSAIVLVDTQPGAGNNSLADGIVPQVVIDHHYPIREGIERIDFTDIRTDMGATSTLAYQYLEAAGIIPDDILATAVFYGIHTDTMGLSRGGSPDDQEIYIRLLRLINRDILAQIVQAKLPREYFSTFTEGLRATHVYGRVVICRLGEMHRPDFVAEMADLLIRLENIHAALCLGSHNTTIYFSLRTVHPELDAGALIQKVVAPPAKAGGHGIAAGGRVTAAGVAADQIIENIEEKFLKAMGESTQKGECLLM